VDPGDQHRLDVRRLLRLEGERGLTHKGRMPTRRVLTDVLGLFEGPRGPQILTWHVHSGGQLPQIPIDDRLTATLMDLTVTAFPLQLMPEEPGDQWPWSIGDLLAAIRTVPSYAAFTEAARTDPDLLRLFPGGSTEGSTGPDADASSAVIWSVGRGDVTAASLAGAAVAYTLARIQVEGAMDLQQAEKYSRETVQAMRQLAQGRTVLAPHIVALSNLSVSCPVALHSGMLIDAGGIMRGYGVRRVDVSAIASLTTELRLLDVIGPASGDGQWEELERRLKHRGTALNSASRSHEREIDRMRLAVTLASPSDRLFAPVVRGHVVLNPLEGPQYAIEETFEVHRYSPPASPPAIVSEAEAQSVETWSQRTANHPQSLWLGARRLVSAIADRQDPLDGFIDAVVCWENLLGSEAEVTFRLCAGLALLVEPLDPSARGAVFSELQRLYTTRSKLVHGSGEPAPSEAQRHRDRAIEIALIATRAIYDQPHLLEANSSGERNKRLLLSL
jgi:hypothetical protein